MGQHFLDYLENNQFPFEVMGLDLTSSLAHRKYKYLKIHHKNVNLLDKENVSKIISNFKPDYLSHLASFSSVAYSWEHPVESFQNNTNIFLNIVESVREAGLSTRILSIGSSEEYGRLSEKDLPISEDAKLDPINPYAVARVSQEMLSQVYVDSFGLDIIMTRSFNHIGARQKEMFVVSSFAKKLVELKKTGQRKGRISTGDTTIVRDFLDVRDVTAAYYGLLISGKKGEIYNVCSGVGISLKEIIQKMTKVLDIEVDIVVDELLLRPTDNKIIIGSNTKIKNDIGWINIISLDKSIEDIIEFWKDEMGAS